MKYIDDFLNRITMYRLVLYYLIALVGGGIVASGLKLLPFSPFSLVISTCVLLFVSLVANEIFARVYEVPANVESVYISALILALILPTFKIFDDLPLLGWAAVLMVASKFILALRHKHFFNPVAIAVALTALTLDYSANWWVGSRVMLPLVLIGGLLVVRKIKREDMVLAFGVVALSTCIFLSSLHGADPLSTISKVLFDTPLFFLAFVMLTEPLTTPPTHLGQVLYGGLVGFLFAPQLHLGSFYTTPELALVGGNVLSYILSPKAKLNLKLKEKIQLSPDLYDFIFELPYKYNFTPGQYLEWTLGHANPDDRGNRRYFTISSSPTEDNLRLGVKFYSPSSSYKRHLLELKAGDTIVAGQLAGDFTLPRDPQRKLVFLAGGIGITPFRSMVKYLVDTGVRRDIVLFFANKTEDEIIYQDVWNEASKAIGLKTVYVLSDKTKLPANWQGKSGRIDAAMLQQEVPDYKERLYYLSGPHTMVTAFESLLQEMGVPKSQIKTDFFPGFV